MDEMTAVKFLKEYVRMCKMYDSDCSGCPFGEFARKYNSNFCRPTMIEHPEEAVDIIQKWGEEHPQKTMLQDFLEKYQNAPKDIDGMPEFCPRSLGYRTDIELCDSSDDYKCVKCWNRPLEE